MAKCKALMGSAVKGLMLNFGSSVVAEVSARYQSLYHQNLDSEGDRNFHQWALTAASGRPKSTSGV